MGFEEEYPESAGGGAKIGRPDLRRLCPRQLRALELVRTTRQHRGPWLIFVVDVAAGVPASAQPLSVHSHGDTSIMDTAGYVSAVGIIVAIYLATRTINHERSIATNQAKRERAIADNQARHERQVAADRATLDFIASYEIHDREWLKTCSICDFVLTDQNEWGVLFGEGDSSEQPKNRELELTILTYLNHCEIVAIAIDKNIINAELYAKWYKAGYVRRWEKAEPFIRNLRRIRGSDTLYCEFQRLAARWR